jgi:hypothetical protein
MCMVDVCCGDGDYVEGEVGNCVDDGNDVL